MRSKLGFFLVVAALLGLTSGCPSDSDDGSLEDGGMAGADGTETPNDAGGTGGRDSGGSGGSSGEGGSGQGGTGGVGGVVGGSGGRDSGGTGGSVTIEGRTTGRKVDLLFMVDDSHTMQQEQAALRAQFPRLIETLLAGVDLDGDGTLEYDGAKDVHLGVVSSDLGLPGIDGVPDCNGLGDEGRLNALASTEVPGCSAQTFTPPFLSFVEGDDVAQTATDFACLATLGTDGCGFEQQLESTLKAVWPGSDQRVTFVTDMNGFGMFGNAGPGFPNGDFIRNDPTDLSLVAIVLVTDEEDCSSRRMDHFQLPPSGNPERDMQSLDLRCYYESLRGPDSNLFMIERYTQLFKLLREGSEQLVLFGAIVGVPPELVTRERVAAVDYDDPSAVDGFYDSILAAEKMQYAIDDNGTPADPQDDKLQASCTRGANDADARAYPPRRIVQVAKSFGRNGFVQSICEEDFVPAIDLIITRIAETFEPVVD